MGSWRIKKAWNYEKLENLKNLELKINVLRKMDYNCFEDFFEWFLNIV